MSNRANCIAFTNHKGGTGKTTSCVSVAGLLAKSGRKTLVVDFDPQANATSALGIDATSLECSIYDAVLKECGHEGVSLKEALLDTGIENLHLAPAEFDLSAAEILLVANPFALSRILDDLKPFYDFILIDLPTCSGMMTINGICAAEHLVVPLDPGIFALEAVDNLDRTLRMIRELTGHTVAMSTALLTRCVLPGFFARLRGAHNPCQQMEAALKKRFRTVFTIPDAPEICRSQQAGMPISIYAPESAVGRAYRKIAEYIAEGKM